MKNAIFALTSLIFIAGCAVSPGAAAAAEVEQNKNTPQQKVLAFNLEGFSEKGDKQWDIQGDSAETMQGDKIKLNNIVAKTFGDEAQATLSADKGVYDKSRNNVTLEENVKVTIDNTPRMAEEYVDFSLGDITGKDKVKGASPKKKGMTIITCDGDVEFNYQKNKAHFSKNVKVLNEGSEIDADKIVVLLNTRTKKINKVIAIGHVKITRGENISYSDRATYIAAQKKVILNGRPKLVFYQEGGLEGNF